MEDMVSKALRGRRRWLGVLRRPLLRSCDGVVLVMVVKKKKKEEGRGGYKASALQRKGLLLPFVGMYRGKKRRMVWMKGKCRAKARCEGPCAWRFFFFFFFSFSATCFFIHLL